mgnify:CR=1 FL=1
MRIVNDSNGKPSFPYALDCNIGTNYFLAFFVTNFPFIVDLSSKPVLIRVEKSRKAPFPRSSSSSTLALPVNEKTTHGLFGK